MKWLFGQVCKFILLEAGDMETYQYAGRKMEMHMLPATSIGDCMIVKFQNKTMLIDTNSQVDKVKTIESCKQLAPKIDYIMISCWRKLP